MLATIRAPIGPFLSASAASSAPIGAATCSGVCAAEACDWSSRHRDHSFGMIATREELSTCWK